MNRENYGVFTCKRPKCGKSWRSRKYIESGEIPVQCPHCKSMQWNEEPKR